MIKVGKRLIKSAKQALTVSDIIERLDLVDESGAHTVIVTKRGKLVATVHGMRPPSYGERK